MSATSGDARRLLADALEISEAEVGDDASIFTLEAWDSLAHMRLVAALERELGRSLDAAEIVGIATVSDVESLVKT